MDSTENRRSFLVRLSKGLLTSFFAFLNVNYVKSFSRLSVVKKMPRINPAYKVNVYKDGSVELYTHDSQKQKLTYTFKEMMADLLLMVLNGKNPVDNTNELAVKYGVDEEKCLEKIQSYLDRFEQKGFIYYGELMKVKIQGAENE